MTDSVKRNIITGKYVNLACLLIPDFEAPKASTDDMNGFEFFRRDMKIRRLDRVLNITQFYKAFGIYKRIMCEAYPLRRNELDLYEADIGNIFSIIEIFLPVSCAVFQTSCSLSRERDQS